MDRGTLAVERAREIFGGRIDDILGMVRQDRHDLHGWEEPAHLRSVLRRTQQVGADMSSEQGSVALMEPQVARRATEPEPGQQREGLGQLLDAGICALEKMHVPHSMTAEERLGLECVVLLYGRPALGVSHNRLAGSLPAFWSRLEDCRADIDMALSAVGRICLMGHPEFDFAGTACLVSESTLMTTRRTAEAFVECKQGHWQMRPGITAWMDYRSEEVDLASARYQIRRIIGVHDYYDLAMFEVEPPQAHSNGTPTPLLLSAQCPTSLPGRPVYMISYPVCDSRRSEPSAITRMFRDVYNIKRVQPGMLRGVTPFNEVQILHHDCCSVGQSSGGCIIDLETHQVLGMQTTSRYMEPGTAIPLWALRDEPLFRQAGVTFADVNRQEMESTACRLERLSRTRYWREVCDLIAAMHQRAFGSES